MTHTADVCKSARDTILLDALKGRLHAGVEEWAGLGSSMRCTVVHTNYVVLQRKYHLCCEGFEQLAHFTRISHVPSLHAHPLDISKNIFGSFTY